MNKQLIFSYRALFGYALKAIASKMGIVYPVVLPESSGRRELSPLSLKKALSPSMGFLKSLLAILLV